MMDIETIMAARYAVMSKHKKRYETSLRRDRFNQFTDKQCQWCNAFIKQPLASFCSDECRKKHEQSEKIYKMREREKASAKRAR